MPASSRNDRVLKLVRKMGVVRPKDLASHGIAPIYLDRMCQRGLLTKVARGLYTATGHEPAVHHTMVGVSKRVPRGARRRAPGR
ncbi:MAG: type IV toxin-antitoxin system AbiEi family antitoxin domain-containing protein [Verrucomicrobia bacterium]|nr:type IV toxin-antitoxin system AbiEi family antitoxin domain-containing protein [Verrucomicrobiota bacterium]